MIQSTLFGGSRFIPVIQSSAATTCITPSPPRYRDDKYKRHWFHSTNRIQDKVFLYSRLHLHAFHKTNVAIGSAYLAHYESEVGVWCFADSITLRALNLYHAFTSTHSHLSTPHGRLACVIQLNIFILLSMSSPIVQRTSSKASTLAICCQSSGSMCLYTLML